MRTLNLRGEEVVNAVAGAALKQLVSQALVAPGGVPAGRLDHLPQVKKITQMRGCTYAARRPPLRVVMSQILPPVVLVALVVLAVLSCGSSARTPRQQERLQIFRQRHSPRRIGNYLRFRLGCSTLPVVMGRRDSTPRHQRHCQQCGTAAVGDERHLVFECPAVQHIRDYHSDLFWDGQSMREFVNQTDQAAVMDFIVASTP